MERSNLRVLAADDEYWARQNIRLAIDWEANGFAFLEPACDGREALGRIRSEKPDIVIADVNMPSLSGTELAKICQKECPDTLFIMLSGYNDFSFVHAALVAGTVDYLLKPVSRADLLNALRSASSRLRSLRENIGYSRSAMEQIRIERSLADDCELSKALAPGPLPPRIAEYELEFSGFALALFYTPKLISGVSPKKLVQVKDLLLREFGFQKAFAFHNSNAVGEFALVSEAQPQAVATHCERALDLVSREAGRPVLAAGSGYYYSFSSLKAAYSEARTGMLSCPCGDKNSLASPRPPARNAIVSPEMEKRLAHALSERKRGMFEDMLFREANLNLASIESFSYGDVRQAFETVCWMLKDCEAPQKDQMLKAVDSFLFNTAIALLEELIALRFMAGTSHGAPAKEIAALAKAHIDENYADDLSLASLSAQFHIDPSYLSREFKRVVGENLMQYIASVRIEKAKAYLKAGKLSSSEIAALVGYGDYSYFSRVFRKTAGESPTSYAARERGE
ncbi:MAG: helix-turn-helix domain-containing protein [Clostridiales bacterium]|jgi:YesN/AraC family two-component response regulator|nr:helix-turn-helix domain-containing protein [Clostridiales bacterium]MDR2751955.1 helix-turn-helix domain-containing protein [Clostridiales bacterium]